MGAKIKGAGTNVIKIDIKETFKNVSYNVMPDRIEAGNAFMCYCNYRRENRTK